MKIDYNSLLPENILDEGYPTEEFLLWIKNFNPFQHDLLSFIQIIMDNWNHGNYGYKLKRKYKKKNSFELHTLGWSGNKSIISALENNDYFFLLYWRKTIVGGHYYFKLRIE